jgi:hypothetical protein
MAPEKAPHDLLKRLLDAQQISKEMLEKSDKISSNQVVLGELRNKFNTINCKILFPTSLYDMPNNL